MLDYDEPRLRPEEHEAMKIFNGYIFAKYGRRSNNRCFPIFAIPLSELENQWSAVHDVSSWKTYTYSVPTSVQYRLDRHEDMEIVLSMHVFHPFLKKLKGYSPYCLERSVLVVHVERATQPRRNSRQCLVNLSRLALVHSASRGRWWVAIRCALPFSMS